MALAILSAGFPLARVRANTAGGAEQILLTLDRALTLSGHHSIVIAPEGSRVAGTLVPIPAHPGELDESALAEAERDCRRAIADTLAKWPADLVHLHGHDFAAYMPAEGPAVLVTLHVPREWYGTHVFPLLRPRTALNCVSETQRAAWMDIAPLPPVIQNGVPLEQFQLARKKRAYALALGRISPEKGFPTALAAAARAGINLVLAGELSRYAAHRDYFERQIRPALSAGRAHFAGPVGGPRKRRLLSEARCLLIPSLAAETSSLVAMEAFASGTPVVAYPAGALAEIVDHGRTGFLVRTEAEMADAIEACGSIDPAICRQVACERFSSERMAGEYLRLYEQLTHASASARAPL